MERRDRLLEAISLYRAYEVDFADALVAAAARTEGPSEIRSFDREFDRIPGLTRSAPD